jgi:hypothetical protein
MNKVLWVSILLLSLNVVSFAQGRTEYLIISWPAEYECKTVSQKDDGNVQTTMIIPGKDSVANATIVGSLSSYRELKFSNPKKIVANYKSRLDSGTVLTELETSQKDRYPWVIFKVETSASSKYPEAESDLYFVVQGKFALYENFVGIKEPSLSEEFVKKWIAIFMTYKIVTN